jgi:hypothetical protein
VGSDRTDPDTTTALRVILAVAIRGAAFDVDDVHAELLARGQAVHPKAIGNAFRIAHGEKLIEVIGQKQSTRAAARGRRIPIYRWQGAAGR